MLNKQEKAKLTAIESAYLKDESMVKHCVNEAAFLYDFRGKTVVIEKRKIKTNFCYGYSDSRYDTKDFDRAVDMAEYARTNHLYFIRKNHKSAGYSEIIECLNNGLWKTYARPHYYGNCPDLYSIDFCHFWEEVPKGAIELTDTEKAEYKLVLVKAIKEHHKKIMAYLKRYGLEKVNSWTYWQDE